MTQLSRRHLLGLLGGLATLGPTPAQAEEAVGMARGPAVPFDPEIVVNRARALAAAYVPPPAVSADWLGLSYDAFRGIWFNTRHTLFRGTSRAVQAEFFVAGLYFLHKTGTLAELRAELWRGGQRVAEVWLNRWVPA